MRDIGIEETWRGMSRNMERYRDRGDKDREDMHGVG